VVALALLLMCGAARAQNVQPAEPASFAPFFCARNSVRPYRALLIEYACSHGRMGVVTRFAALMTLR